MRTEFLRRVNDVLLRVLEQPRDERPAFLDAACGGDGDLRREVETLLAAGSSDSLLNVGQAAFELLPAPGDVSPAPEILETGERLGPYVVEKRIGDGGTGAVYLATKQDGELTKRVAVKVLKRGMDTDEIVRRFRQESRILAHLDHPNISRWYESGTTGDDRPYLVMEFIDGEPIHRYASRRGLSVRERLAIFLKVCDAVQVAHQHLVIHRDLKPSNILVTRDGEPKLLDFGIAKILEPDAEEAPTVTVMTNRPLTPAYASPEHIQEQAMTTASDVYSLGVVLFELLTDQRPYEVTSPLETDIRQVVCFQEPRKPSAAVTRNRDPAARRLARRLEGDLDKIVLTALSKRPGDRYASVDQLALDIRRHLAGLPVHARPATITYRTGKYLRRHRKAIVVIVAFALLLVLYAVDRERTHRRLTRERDNAQHVADWVTAVFEVGEPTDELSVRDLLDRGAETAERKLADQPERLAQVLTKIGVSYKNLAVYDDAERLLVRALELRRRHYGDVHLAVADSLHLLSQLETDRGRYARTRELLDESLAIYLELEGRQHAQVVELRHEIAMVLMRQGLYADAEPRLRQVLETLLHTAGPGSAEVTTVKGNLAVLLYYRGLYSEAESLLREALRKSIDEVGEDDGRSTANKQNLATCLMAQGRYDEAEPLFREVLASRSSGQEYPGLAYILFSLGDLMLLRGELDEADHYFHRTFAIGDRLLGNEHPRLAHYRSVQARLMLARGEAEAAEALVRDAIAVLERKVQPLHWWTLSARAALGAALTRQGRFAEAEPLLIESYAGLSDQLTPQARCVRETLRDLVELYEAWSRPARAREYRALLR